MKKLLLRVFTYAICLLPMATVSQVNAQETIVTYIKENGGRTTLKDSAAYTSVLRTTPNNEGLYGLDDYYPDGTLKRHGWVKAPDPQRLRFEGLVETYYDNGERETVIRYADNRPVDTAERYYRNGVLREREVYLDATDAGNPFAALDTRLVYYADSLGNAQVVDGNGQASITNDDLDVERGQYVDGRRDGRWEGTFMKAKYRFEEWYEDGKVVRGVSVDSVGNEYPYQKEGIQPEYPGGVHALRKFIAEHYKFPKEALKAKVQGQLVITFVVDRSGVPTDFEVVNDLGYNTAPAAFAAMKRSARWSPGYMRGVPVRVKYSLPIQLNLSR